MDEVANLKELRYAHGERWETLPKWCYFFIHLGYAVATRKESKDRLVVGLAIPTRAYAAALSTFGVVIGRETIPTREVDADEHFQRLCTLEIGTPVIYRKANRKLKGRFVGCEEVEGRVWVKVRLEKKHCAKSGGWTQYVPPDDVLKVEVLSTETTRLPYRQKGRRIVLNEKFLRHCLGESDLTEFATQSRLECVILGQISTLKHEIEETPFAIKSSDTTFEEGVLQDVLRVRQFLGEGEAYRSNVLSMVGSQPPKTVDDAVPYVTIFDGALSFLKWRDDWRRSDWIVLLDRTEPNFSEAADMLNQEYIQNRVSEGGISLPPVPSGVEAIVYQESRQ